MRMKSKIIFNNNEENQNNLNYENEEIEHQNYDEINDNVNYK